jgi:thymidylate synthase
MAISEPDAPHLGRRRRAARPHGVGTRSLFGATIRCDLSGGRMPLVTTKRVFWKTATREFLWFLTGDTNIRALCAQGVEIWTDWPLAHYRRETGETISREDFPHRGRCRLCRALGRSGAGVWQAVGGLAGV